jgi:hypothetical protein
MKLLKITAAAAAVIVLAALVAIRVRQPSNERNWTVDQTRLARAEIKGPIVHLRDIRNFDYRSETDYTPGYYDKSFDLRKLDSVWFVVEPFGEVAGPAHTFLSFGFGPDDFVSVSVEIRKEKGESFSPLKGLLRNYELMYVVGDERDLIRLRSNYRGDDVYLYRVRTTPERMRALFVDMLTRANHVGERPEFYNTLTNTCTTNIVRHVNRIVPGRVPLRMGVLLPGFADELAQELELIDSSTPIEELRRRHRINDLALQYDGDPAFSRLIRQRIDR